MVPQKTQFTPWSEYHAASDRVARLHALWKEDIRERGCVPGNPLDIEYAAAKAALAAMTAADIALAAELYP
jgi:hypothetical protein